MIIFGFEVREKIRKKSKRKRKRKGKRKRKEKKKKIRKRKKREEKEEFHSPFFLFIIYLFIQFPFFLFSFFLFFFFFFSFLFFLPPFFSFVLSFFLLVVTGHTSRSPNDRRFFLIRDILKYLSPLSLLSLPLLMTFPLSLRVETSLKWVMMTDLRDVILARDPFVFADNQLVHPKVERKIQFIFFIQFFSPLFSHFFFF